MLQAMEKAREFIASPRRMLIGGEWVDALSGETLPVEDPTTGEILGHVPAGDAADVDRAVRAARAAFASRVWRGKTADERSAIMWRLGDLIDANAEELRSLEIYDNGMPGWFADAIVGGAAASMRYFAGQCSNLHGRTAQVGGDLEFHGFSVVEPVGVAALITPWNGPIATLCNKLAPALAAGCSVVSKPAELTSLTALRVAELCIEAGIPDGVVNVVTGYGHIAGAALADHPDVDKISFTGSTVVGKSIVRSSAGNLKRVSLELGGKSPVFVFDDADLELAIPAVAMGIFANSGQICFAGSRLYAQPKIYDKLVAGVEAFAKNIVMGSGFDSSVQLGPLVSQKQRDRVMGYIESGVDEGGELVTGGRTHGDKGWFVEPTIFAGVRADMRIANEEIFGPVLSVMRFDSLDEVPGLGNATPYGLGAGIYTTNVTNAHKAARLLDAGNVWVNCYGRLDKSLPFGGFKQSGWGRENGVEGVDAFLEKKAVYIKL